MNHVQEAINAAYLAQVQTLYNGLATNLLSTYDDETSIAKAQKKFIKGLIHAEQSKTIAMNSVSAIETLSPDDKVKAINDTDGVESLGLLFCPKCQSYHVKEAGCY